MSRKRKQTKKSKFVYASVGPTFYGKRWGEAAEKAKKHPEITVVAMDLKFPKTKPPKNVIPIKADVLSEKQSFKGVNKADKVVINFLSDTAPILSNKFLRSIPKKDSKIVIRLTKQEYDASKLNMEKMMKRLNNYGFAISKLEERAKDRSAPLDLPYVKVVGVRGKPREIEKKGFFKWLKNLFS